jgi:periplasmic copper chaperone A
MENATMRPALVAAVTMLAVLGGCKQAPSPKPPEKVEVKPGVTLSDGQLRLPAVKGNPGAAYFTVANSAAGGTVTISSVAITGAGKTEMHETRDGAMSPVDRVEVGPGSMVKFAPGGLHVMAFELDPKLTAGGTTDLAVTFADGTKAALPLKLVAAGSTDHGASH